MADEVERACVLSGKIHDRRMNMLGEKVERLSPAGVVEVERGKAGLPQRAVQFPERPGGTRDAVKQNHRRRWRVRRWKTGGIFPDHATSRSGARVFFRGFLYVFLYVFLGERRRGHIVGLAGTEQRQLVDDLDDGGNGQFGSS